ncbi:hypothetical protein YC2023_088301 [Brassica napus]
MFVYVSRDLRPATCDLRLRTNRRSHVTRQQNEQQPATCDQSQVACRRSQVARHVNKHDIYTLV